MRQQLLKITLALVIIFSTAFLAKAQKFGDNLGNHKASKDLILQDHKILGANGISIGSATITNESVALQVTGTDKAIVITGVATTTTILNPTKGMIVYDTVLEKFFVYQGVAGVNGAWVSFALGLDTDGDGINNTGNSNGYTLTVNANNETVLRLSAADEINPGIVTTVAQTFGGDKTFGGDVVIGSTSSTTTGKNNLLVTGSTTISGSAAVGSTLNVTGATTLGDNLLVTGVTTLTNNVHAGANLTVTGATTLSGSVGMTGIASATGTDDAERFIIVNAAGQVLKTNFSTNSFGKFKVQVPTGTVGNFNQDNLGVDIELTIPGIKQDNGIVVNFFSTDKPKFAGLTIMSAVANADDKVTVSIADLRVPADDGSYVAPDIASGSFTVTRYKAASVDVAP